MPVPMHCQYRHSLIPAWIRDNISTVPQSSPPASPWVTVMRGAQLPRDNVFVDLVISVQFQVQKENLYDAFYKLTDSRQQISSYVYDTVRASVPKMDLDNVFESKEEIASR
eukprot:363600-Chlamydomonas_euryale.AAC.4